jgi:hypothetical protein
LARAESSPISADLLNFKRKSGEERCSELWERKSIIDPNTSEKTNELGVSMYSSNVRNSLFASKNDLFTSRVSVSEDKPNNWLEESGRFADGD